jgi:hypothetical protein
VPIAQLLLAVLIMVMFGLVFMAGKAFHAVLAGLLRLHFVDLGRFRLKLWPSGVSIVAFAAVCLWAISAGNYSESIVVVLAVISFIVLSDVTASPHSTATVLSMSAYRKARKLFTAPWSGCSRLVGVSLDSRRHDLVAKSVSVITFSRVYVLAFKPHAILGRG